MKRTFDGMTVIFSPSTLEQKAWNEEEKMVNKITDSINAFEVSSFLTNDRKN